MKGIVLAGGTGSRLRPITSAVSKQLLPVYDKPMIYYPLGTLMAAGLREILVITTPHDADAFRNLLGDGSTLGISISYVAQPSPDGLAQAFILGEEFLAGEGAALILGDNLFHGVGLGRHLSKYLNVQGAHIFAYQVSDPTDYGVVELNSSGDVVSIEEKPTVARSPYAVTGLYFYGKDIVDVAGSIIPSHRGELEITDVNRTYLERGLLSVSVLPRGTVWLDTGTFRSLQDAGNYVRVVEERQGSKVGCLEEIAWRQGWIDSEQLDKLAHPLRKSGYGEYLYRVLLEGNSSGASELDP